jgi:predicted nucleic acid-binding protein
MNISSNHPSKSKFLAFDTNVIVDVLTKREPFFSDSVKVLDKAERGDCTAWVCATTVTTIFYLVRRHLGSDETIERLRDLTAIYNVPMLGTHKTALTNPLPRRSRSRRAKRNPNQNRRGAPSSGWQASNVGQE